jgi:hypothetical protein
VSDKKNVENEMELLNDKNVEQNATENITKALMTHKENAISFSSFLVSFMKVYW